MLKLVANKISYLPTIYHIIIISFIYYFTLSL